MGSVRSFLNLKDDLQKKQNHFKDVLSCVLNDSTDMFIVSKDNEIVPFHKSLLTLFSPLVARLLSDVPCCVAPTVFLPDFPAHLIRKFLLLLKSGQAVSGKNVKLDILFIHKIASTLMIKVENLGEGQYVENPLGAKIKQENIELNIKQELSEVDQEDDGVGDSEYVEDDESEKMLQEDALDDSNSDTYLTELLSELNADSESLTDSLIDKGRHETSEINAENDDKDNEQEEMDDKDNEQEGMDVEDNEQEKMDDEDNEQEVIDDKDNEQEEIDNNSNDIFSIASFFDESISSDNSMDSDEDDYDESPVQHNLSENEMTKNSENLPSIIIEKSNRALLMENSSTPSSPQTKSNSPPHKNPEIPSTILPSKETSIHSAPSNMSSQINSKSKKETNLMTLIPITPPKERREHRVPNTKYIMTKEPTEKIVNSNENKFTEISTSTKFPRERDAFMRTINNGGMNFTNNEYSEVFNFIIEEDAPKIKVEPEENIMQREEDKMKRIDIMSTLQNLLSSEEHVESKEKEFSLPHDMEMENLDNAIANAKQAEKDDIDCLLDDIDNLENLEKEFVKENDNLVQAESREINKSETNIDNKTSGGKRKRSGTNNINKKVKINSNIPKVTRKTILILDDSE